MQQLELELRKSNKKTTVAAEPTVDASLVQEVANLKKELETAERIAKQADVCRYSNIYNFHH